MNWEHTGRGQWLDQEPGVPFQLREPLHRHTFAGTGVHPPSHPMVAISPPLAPKVLLLKSCFLEARITLR